jgi:hypothetical protein
MIWEQLSSGVPHQRKTISTARPPKLFFLPLPSFVIRHPTLFAASLLSSRPRLRPSHSLAARVRARLRSALCIIFQEVDSSGHLIILRFHFFSPSARALAAIRLPGKNPSPRSSALHLMKYTQIVFFSHLIRP